MTKMTEATEAHLTWDKTLNSFAPRARHVKFLRGPVPWVWIEMAALLPGKALHVGLALWRLSGAMKSRTVRLGNPELESIGIDRNAKSRALRALGNAGLISVEQLPGRMPRVTILDV